jgi:hypothetical protein
VRCKQAQKNKERERERAINMLKSIGYKDVAAINIDFFILVNK